MFIQLPKEDRLLEEEFLHFCDPKMRYPYLKLRLEYRKKILYSYELHKKWLINKEKKRGVKERVFVKMNNEIEYLAFVHDLIFHFARSRNDADSRFINVFITPEGFVYTKALNPYTNQRCRLLTIPFQWQQQAKNRLQDADLFGHLVSDIAIDRFTGVTSVRLRREETKLDIVRRVNAGKTETVLKGYEVNMSVRRARYILKKFK